MANDVISLSRQLVLGELLARWSRRSPDREMPVLAMLCREMQQERF